MNKVDLLDTRELYVQTKDLIREYIRTHDLRPNHRLPTNREFSRMMNVSQLTVQRAIAALAEEGLLYARRGKGTFIRDLGASPGAPRPRSGLFACVIPSIQSNTVAATAHALDDLIFNASGHHLIVCNSQNDADREIRLLDSLLKRSIDALIYQSMPPLRMRPVLANAVDVRLQKFLAAGVPVVMLDDFYTPDRYDTILPDESRTCELAVKHLMELGHRRLLFIGHPDFFKVKIAAFQQVIRAAGLKDEEVRIELEADDEPAKTAVKALDRALSEGWLFTAIVAATDHVALACVQHLRSKGISCPEDVSVIGADNLEYVEHMDIPLTTIWCEPREVAVQVQRVIEARLAEADLRKAAPRRIEMAPTLVLRQSTGPALLRCGTPPTSAGNPA